MYSFARIFSISLFGMAGRPDKRDVWVLLLLPPLPHSVSSCTRRMLMYVPISVVEPLPSSLLSSKPLTPVALSLPSPGSPAPARKENGGLLITASSKTNKGQSSPVIPLLRTIQLGSCSPVPYPPVCSLAEILPWTLQWMELILTCIGRVARIGASSWRSLPEFGRYTLYDGVHCSLAQLDGMALF